MAYGNIATYGDVFRGYIKPSLKGGIVLRKKSTEVVSGKKIARMDMFRNTMGGRDGCVVKARNEARKAVRGGGNLWTEYIRQLKSCASSLKTGSGPATIGRREYATAFWKHGGHPGYIKTSPAGGGGAGVE